MKTLKTNLGIEYDIEIVEVGVKNIIVNVTCEEASKEFMLTFDYPIKEDNAFYSQVINNDCTQITYTDLADAINWVNETTVGYLASEIAKICVRNSVNGDQFAYSFTTLGCLLLTISKINPNQDVLSVRSCNNYHAEGETEIKELINKLK